MCTFEKWNKDNNEKIPHNFIAGYKVTENVSILFNNCSSKSPMTLDFKNLAGVLL